MKIQGLDISVKVLGAFQWAGAYQDHPSKGKGKFMHLAIFVKKKEAKCPLVLWAPHSTPGHIALASVLVVT